MRFSPDKTPYKTNAAGYLSGGEKSALYYVSLSADSLFAATGYYQMAADQLKKYRAALSTDEHAVELGDELRTIVARDNVEGEQLKTAPRGIAKDSVNLDLLRYKSLIVTGEIDSETADRDTALAHAIAVWKRGKALNDWLGRNVGPTTLDR